MFNPRENHGNSDGGYNTLYSPLKHVPFSPGCLMDSTPSLRTRVWDGVPLVILVDDLCAIFAIAKPCKSSCYK